MKIILILLGLMMSSCLVRTQYITIPEPYYVEIVCPEVTHRPNIQPISIELPPEEIYLRRLNNISEIRKYVQQVVIRIRCMEDSWEKIRLELESKAEE